MPPRPQVAPTDDWRRIALLARAPGQRSYELIRPVVLFGQSPAERAAETGAAARTLARQVARFDQLGMESLLPPPKVEKHRSLPAEVRQAILDAKREHPPLNTHELTTICWARCGHRPSSHTVKRVLAESAPPPRTHRRFPPYHAIADPIERRRAVVTLYLDGWSAKAIAGDLETSRPTVSEVRRRWDEEGWPGLADRPFGPHRPARKVDLRAMAAIRRLQANPELGEFRVHAALAQQGIDLSPRTCGRILARHRALGAPRPIRHEGVPRPMPFAATRWHQWWSVDVRYVEEHHLGTDKPAYVIAVLDHFSRAILASAISPRQDLTAYLVVLRAALERYGAPEGLVSDSGGIFRATQARAVYAALGIEKREIDRGQAWQNYIETMFSVMRRMADAHFAGATTWEELNATHARFVWDYNRQPHTAHQAHRADRRSPLAVLSWVRGRPCDAAELEQPFRWRATRLIRPGGFVRFRHWRLYGERDLSGTTIAVWLAGDTLTLEHQAQALAQYRVTYEADAHHVREVADPRLFPSRVRSPQPILPRFAAIAWHPARRLAPYQPRRRRSDAWQTRLRFDSGPDAMTG